MNRAGIFFCAASGKNLAATDACLNCPGGKEHSRVIERLSRCDIVEVECGNISIPGSRHDPVARQVGRKVFYVKQAARAVNE